MIDREITVHLHVYYIKRAGDDGHAAVGWYANPYDDGSENCWYGDPAGPFESPSQALAHIAAELAAE